MAVCLNRASRYTASVANVTERLSVDPRWQRPAVTSRRCRTAQRPIFFAPDLEGGEDTKHTVVISSCPPTDNVELRIDEAIVHTGLETPVHADDTIWINLRSSILECEGNWEELDESTPYLQTSRACRWAW